MKLTENLLRQLVKEEFKRALKEQVLSSTTYPPGTNAPPPPPGSIPLGHGDSRVTAHAQALQQISGYLQSVEQKMGDLAARIQRLEQGSTQSNT
jgi:hypothetical protein